MIWPQESVHITDVGHMGALSMWLHRISPQLAVLWEQYHSILKSLVRPELRNTNAYRCRNHPCRHLRDVVFFWTVDISDGSLLEAHCFNYGLTYSEVSCKLGKVQNWSYIISVFDMYWWSDALLIEIIVQDCMYDGSKDFCKAPTLADSATSKSVRRQITPRFIGKIGCTEWQKDFGTSPSATSQIGSGRKLRLIVAELRSAAISVESSITLHSSARCHKSRTFSGGHFPEQVNVECDPLRSNVYLAERLVKYFGLCRSYAPIKFPYLLVLRP